MSYKLSYTAQEVDELLGKVKGGVCLPVVELSTKPTEEGAKLTAEESAKMDAVFALRLPCVVKVLGVTILMHDCSDTGFIGILNGVMLFGILKTEDGWTARLSLLGAQNG